MISSVAKRKASEPSSAVRLFQPPAQEAESAFWRINGFRTRLVIWTTEQWENLDTRPPDAQYHPSGFWCALRID
jgi:hypothetical protein